MKIIKIIPIFILVLSFGYLFVNKDEYSDIIRYDKYDLFLSLERFILIIIVVIFLRYTIRIVIGNFWNIFYPTNLFLLLFLLLVFPGVLLTSDFSSVGNTSFYGYLASLFLFLVGVLTTHFVFPVKYSKISISKYYSSKSIVYNLLLITFGFGFLISASAFDFQNSIFSSLKLFFATGDVSDNLKNIRQIGEQKGFITLLISYSLNLFMPFPSIFFFVNALQIKSKKQLYFSLALMLITILLMASSGARLKALFFILLIMTAYSFVRPITFKNIVNTGSVLLWLLVIQTIALGRISSAADGATMMQTMVISLNRLVERVILTKGAVTQKVFEYIPHYADFKGGETIVASLLGNQSSSLPLSQEMFGFVYGGGTNGTAGPQAFGEAYANFGIAGMLIFSYITGVFVQMMTIYVKRKLINDPLEIVFLAFLTTLIARIGYSNILTFKANGLHILILFYFIIIVTGKIIPSNSPPKKSR